MAHGRNPTDCHGPNVVIYAGNPEASSLEKQFVSLQQDSRFISRIAPSAHAPDTGKETLTVWVAPLRISPLQTTEGSHNCRRWFISLHMNWVKKLVKHRSNGSPERQLWTIAFYLVGQIWRRPTSGQAGPLGGDKPLVTEGGHYVLDVVFTEPIGDPGEPLSRPRSHDLVCLL